MTLILPVKVNFAFAEICDVVMEQNVVVFHFQASSNKAKTNRINASAKDSKTGNPMLTRKLHHRL